MSTFQCFGLRVFRKWCQQTQIDTFVYLKVRLSKVSNTIHIIMFTPWHVGELFLSQHALLHMQQQATQTAYCIFTTAGTCGPFLVTNLCNSNKELNDEQFSNLEWEVPMMHILSCVQDIHVGSFCDKSSVCCVFASLHGYKHLKQYFLWVPTASSTSA